MKRSLALITALALALVTPAYASPRPGDLVVLTQILSGSPSYLGTIDATTTSKTNTQATTTFPSTGDLSGKVLLIQNAGSVDIRLSGVTSGTATVSNSRGVGFAVAIAPGERVIVTLKSNQTHLAVIATSSTANVDVWELR